MDKDGEIPKDATHLRTERLQELHGKSAILGENNSVIEILIISKKFLILSKILLD